MTKGGRSVLILAQAGAVVAPLLSAFEVGGDAPVELLQQEPGESLSAFRQRLHNHLLGIEQAGRSVERGAFVAKSGFGLPDVLATVALLSSLVASMVALGRGSVYLLGHAGDAQASYALEALADAMRDQVRGTGVEVVTDDGLPLADEAALTALGEAPPQPG